MIVLYVDDSALMRRTVRLLLGGEDCDVIAVPSIADARRELRARHVDVVVADLYLGGQQTGLDLLKEVAALWPATRRVLVSGSEDALRGVPPSTAHALLLKPFGLEALHTSMAWPDRAAACAPSVPHGEP